MAKEFPIDPAEVTELVEELAAKLADLAKSEGKLAKAEDSEAKDKDASAEKPAEEVKEPPPSPDAMPEAPAAEGAPAEEPPPAPPAADPAGDPAAAAGDAPVSVEELADMYRSLPPEELEKHKAALAMLQAPPAAPPADPAAALAPPPAAPPAPDMSAMMGKSEEKMKELEGKLAKALEESEKARKEAEAVSTKMVAVLEKVVNQPIQKSENGISWFKRQTAEAAKPLKKSLGEMSKSEIKEKLNEIVRNPKLSKSERDAVNEYVVNGDAKALAKLEKYFQ